MTDELMPVVCTVNENAVVNAIFDASHNISCYLCTDIESEKKRGKSHK